MKKMRQKYKLEKDKRRKSGNSTAKQERTLQPYQTMQKNGGASILLESVEGLDSSKLLAAGRNVAALMHVRVV